MNILEQALTNVVGAVKDAAARVDAQKDPYGTALSKINDNSLYNKGLGFSCGTVDYSRADVPLINFQGFWTREWKGDWLAVARTSIGAPIANLINDHDDQFPVVLSPGAVIKGPFSQVLIFTPGIMFSNTYDTTAVNNAFLVNPSPQPRLIVYFGTGECPFTDTSMPNGSDSSITVEGSASAGGTANVANVSLIVPPGSLFDAHILVSKALGAAGTPQWYVALGWGPTGGPFAGYCYPDTQIPFGGTALGGVNGVTLVFRNMRAPRTRNQFTIIAIDEISVAGNVSIAAPLAICR